MTECFDELNYSCKRTIETRDENNNENLDLKMLEEPPKYEINPGSGEWFYVGSEAAAWLRSIGVFKRKNRSHLYQKYPTLWKYKLTSAERMNLIDRT